MIRVYSSPLGQGSEYNFVHDLGNGVAGGTVTFAALPKVPFACNLTVECPSTGLQISASYVSGTMTTSQFDYMLSGLTTDANYKLHVSLKF